MKLTVVNCAHYTPDRKPCRIVGEFNPAIVCPSCSHRAPTRRPFNMVWSEIDTETPAKAPERTGPVIVCEWRIRENYTADGQAILEAGRLEEIDGKWKVSRAAYLQAQAHRA